MESILKEKIPTQISKHVDDMQFLTESIEDLNYIIVNLRNRLTALESIQPQTKVSPAHQRAEILYDIVMKGNSLNSKQVMYKLGVKQHVQAIRAMKYAAKIYYEDLYLDKYHRGNKSYTLMRRIDCNINPYTCKGLV